MRKFLILTLLGSAYFLSSGCAPQKDSGFGVTLGSNQVILLNTGAKSCQAIHSNSSSSTTVADDVGAIYFSIPKLTVSWTGTNPLVIQYISVTLKSASLTDNEFNCIIGGDSLLYTWYAATQSSQNYTSVSINSGTETNGCPIKCGSVTIKDKKKDAYGTGYVFVYALTKDTEGNDTPVTGEGYVQFEYRGVR